MTADSWGGACSLNDTGRAAWKRVEQKAGQKSASHEAEPNLRMRPPRHTEQRDTIHWHRAGYSQDSGGTPPAREKRSAGLVETNAMQTRSAVEAVPQSRDEVLTRQEVAAWLKVRPRELDRLGVPCLDLGHKTKRYVKEDVVAWLDDQRQASQRRRSAEVDGKQAA